MQRGFATLLYLVLRICGRREDEAASGPHHGRPRVVLERTHRFLLVPVYGHSIGQQLVVVVLCRAQPVPRVHVEVIDHLHPIRALAFDHVSHHLRHALLEVRLGYPQRLDGSVGHDGEITGVMFEHATLAEDLAGFEQSVYGTQELLFRD